MSDARYWIGEIPATCIKTVLVKAASRKEAQAKLRDPSLCEPGDIEGVDVQYKAKGYGRIVGEDKPRGPRGG